jgi:hypothetical protein
MTPEFKIINSYYLTEYGKFAAQVTVLIPADENHEIPIEYQNRTAIICSQQLSQRWGTFAGDSQSSCYRPVDLDPEMAQKYRMADCSIIQADTAAELEQMVDRLIASIREVLHLTVSSYLQRLAQLPERRILTLDPLDLSDIMSPETCMEAEASQASPATENAWKFELTKGDAIEYSNEDGRLSRGLIESAQHHWDYVLINWVDRAARPTRLPYSLIFRHHNPKSTNTFKVSTIATGPRDPLERWRLGLENGDRVSYYWKSRVLQDAIVSLETGDSGSLSIRIYLAANPNQIQMVLRTDVYPRDCVYLDRTWVYRLKAGDRIQYCGECQNRSNWKRILEIHHNYSTCSPMITFAAGDRATIPYQSILNVEHSEPATVNEVCDH